MHLNIWQIIFLALLQGVTELFPISSLGHTVIFPGLFGWGDLVRDTRFLPLITALHLGTSVALVIYFWRDWLQVVRTLINSVKNAEVKRGTDEWVSWLIIFGCIPAGLLGVFLETPLKQLFASPVIAASFLVVNGSILFLGERLRRRAQVKAAAQPALTAKEQEAQARSLTSLSVRDALLVGLAQSLALIPGISRSGSTMVAGLGVGLNHEDSARYSFLLGTPLIGAAALLEVPQLLGISLSEWLLVIVGAALAGVAAYISTKYLMKYFETGRLYPFAVYCWALGLIALGIFLFVLHKGV
ncbi:MAG: undecaprenyl-diphosphate phosphatase [Ktedonobacteraceae bacterium]|nr:undecaprenyl-diphosphate phosphatase [Chloroflexota bacterium]